MVFTAAQKRAYAIRMAAAERLLRRRRRPRAAKKKPEAKEAESKTRIPNTSYGTWRLLLHSRDGLSGRGRRVRKIIRHSDRRSVVRGAWKVPRTRSAQNVKIVDRIRRLCSE